MITVMFQEILPVAVRVDVEMWKATYQQVVQFMQQTLMLT